VFKRLENVLAHRAPQVQAATLPFVNLIQSLSAMCGITLPEDTPVLGEDEDVSAQGTVILISAKAGGRKHSRLMGRLSFHGMRCSISGLRNNLLR
jgi:hypothetical protein